MNDRHERVLSNLAVIAADIAPVGSARVAACILHRNSVISYGVCSNKSNPFQKRFSKNDQSIFLHAEVDAIRNAIKKTKEIDFLKNSILYVCRVKRPKSNSKEFIQGLACPCEGCKKAIATFNIREIIYSNNESGYDYL
jgi:deoxycytidylate deaminase